MNAHAGGLRGETGRAGADDRDVAIQIDHDFLSKRPSGVLHRGMERSLVPAVDARTRNASPVVPLITDIASVRFEHSP